MPQLIDHIDAIARRKGRDVLYVTFFENRAGDRAPYRWTDHPARAALVAWLDSENYVWAPCGEFANENAMYGYRGSIFIDVPFDREDPAYLQLEAFLECPDGSMRFPYTCFLIMGLDQANMNRRHDEPGFWEQWANRY